MIKKSNTEKIILGIDPGTNVMGYGVIRVIGNKAELVVMGVIDMRKEKDPYLRLGRIFERVTGIIDSYLPDEMAIEAPFFGKNVQSMLKLGRAQGVAIAAAIHHDVPIHEYAPLKMRSALVPVVSFSSQWAMWVIIAGMLLLNTYPALFWIGIGMIAVSAVFSIITLPVEYNASARAMEWLTGSYTLKGEQAAQAKEALAWAARTYLVAALSAVVTLIYYIGIARRQ